MATGYLLDTAILIQHLRGRRTAVCLLRGLGSKTRLSISAVTRAEIRAGMRHKEDRLTRKLLSRLDTVPVDGQIADRAGELVRRAQAQGKTLHLVDAIIAATASRRGLVLLTLNRSHFEGLGLRLYPTQDETLE